MTQEHAFVAYCKAKFGIEVTRHLKDGYGAFEEQWRGWQASRESLKQELLSDEMVKLFGSIKLDTYKDIYGDIRLTEHGAKRIAKVALKAIAEKL